MVDVEVVTATVDLEEIRSHRNSISRGLQATVSPSYHRIQADISLTKSSDFWDKTLKPTKEIQVRYHSAEEEIA